MCDLPQSDWRRFRDNCFSFSVIGQGGDAVVLTSSTDSLALVRAHSKPSRPADKAVMPMFPRCHVMVSADHPATRVSSMSSIGSSAFRVGASRGDRGSL